MAAWTQRDQISGKTREQSTPRVTTMAGRAKKEGQKRAKKGVMLFHVTIDVLLTRKLRASG